MRPNQDGQVGPRPRIVAHFDDGAGSGIDPSTVQVTLDGADVTNAANVTASGIDFRPGSELAAGSHNVALSVKDKAGNQATTNWTFMAAENRSVARSLRFTALPVYDAGKEIQVTLDADPGATATFSIGGRHREIPMHESSPGHYVGHYTVKEGDYFNNESVRAHLHTSDGKDYSVDADDRLGVQSIEMRQPHLVSPKENEQVNSPLILKGTAAPYSTVMVHVAYSALVFANQVRVHGTLGDFTVTADQNGYFQTPIDLGRIHGANKRYQITAWSIDSNGKKSEQSTLNVFQ